MWTRVKQSMLHSKISSLPTGTTLKEAALLLLLAVLWGSPYALTKIALETIAPVTIAAARVAIAAIVLWGVVIALGREVPTRPQLAKDLFAQGCLSAIVPYTLITWGQQTVDSALTTILSSGAPLFVGLITLVWTRHEAITFTRLFGILAGLFGVILIVGVTALESLGKQLAGQAAIVAATLSIALSAIYGRRFAGVAPEVTAAGMLSWSALVLVPASAIAEWPLKEPSALSVAALLASAILCTAAGFVLYFRLVRTLGSMGIASCGFLKTGIGVLLGCLFLGEAFTWQMQIGLAAVLIGVTAINRDTIPGAMQTAAAPSPLKSPETAGSGPHSGSSR
jgi:drug/metabolite transporter (DMT)-like permease